MSRILSRACFDSSSILEKDGSVTGKAALITGLLIFFAVEGRRGGAKAYPISALRAFNKVKKAYI